MNIADLKSFLAVVEWRSISLAAKKMHISQPALSKRIKKMEMVWNTELFVSSGLRTELTPKGMQLLPYVRQMIYLYDEIMSHETVDKKSSSALLINVGSPMFVSKTIIPPFMVNLNSIEHYYVINTKIITEKNVEESLSDGSCDIMIMPKLINNSGKIIAIPLWKEKLIACVSKKHPLSATRKITLAELSTYPVIVMERPFSIRRIIDELSEERNLPMNVIAETNAIYNVMAMVEAGVGWSLIYKCLLNANLKALTLEDIVLPEIEYYGYFLKRRMEERLITNFVDNLRNWLMISKKI